jgi:CTP:molybdopterin cytidylyltransferase MocA
MGLVMTELSFLLDLLLNHKLAKVTRELVVARIREVEVRSQSPAATRPAQTSAAIPPHLVGQSPSTIAAMMRHEAGGVAPPIAVAPLVDTPPVVAQTPAAAAALAARQSVIDSAISGKPEKGRTSPRKF